MPIYSVLLTGAGGSLGFFGCFGFLVSFLPLSLAIWLPLPAKLVLRPLYLPK